MYLVYTRMPGESYRRRLRSLLYLCCVFPKLMNSLVCWLICPFSPCRGRSSSASSSHASLLQAIGSVMSLALCLLVVSLSLFQAIGSVMSLVLCPLVVSLYRPGDRWCDDLSFVPAGSVSVSLPGDRWCDVLGFVPCVLCLCGIQLTLHEMSRKKRKTQQTKSTYKGVN